MKPAGLAPGREAGTTLQQGRNDMHDAKLFTGQTKSGGFKAFVTGYTEKFGNRRMVTLEGQPHRGFPTRELAIEHAKARAPTREALVDLAANTINGQFISQERMRDLMMEELDLPHSANPTGPVMPLAGLTARTPSRQSGAEPDSEEKIVRDATRQLEADSSLAGRLQASVAVVTRTKNLRRTKEAEAARQLHDAPAGEAASHTTELQMGIRKFANAGELLIQYLLHSEQIATLEAQRTTLWGALLAEFGTPEKAKAMVDQARGIGAAWERDAAASAPPA